MVWYRAIILSTTPCSLALYSFSVGVEDTFTVTVYVLVAPFCAVTLYFTGLEKSCTTPDAGDTVANSESVMLGANLVDVPAGRVRVMELFITSISPFTEP